MKRKNRCIAILAAIAIVAAACVPRVQEPEVTLAGVRLGGLGLQGGLVYVELAVVNPNRFALQGGGLTYDLELRDPDAADDGEWIDFSDGEVERGFRVEGGDSAHIEVPVEFTYSGVGSAVRSLLRTGTFEYRLRGTVELDQPLRTDVPYSRRGMFTISGSH